MYFKKIAALIVLTSVSCLSYASLHTENYTNEDSTVKITSLPKGTRCSIEAGVYTPKQNAKGPGKSDASDSEIKLLCLGTKGNLCTADIFSNRDCAGIRVGHAVLDLKAGNVVSLISDDSRYVFVSEDDGTKLMIKYS